MHPEHRGSGYGRALITEVERLLLARGCPRLNLQVRATNDEALGLLPRAGYEIGETVSLGKRLIRDDRP